MKLYFHIQVESPKSTPPNNNYVTAAVRIADNSDSISLKKCMQDILKQFSEQHKVKVNNKPIDKLLINNKKPVAADKNVNTVPDGSDLYFNTSLEESKDKVVYEKTLINKSKVVASSGTVEFEKVTDPKINASLTKAKMYVKAKKENLALSLFREILETHPDDNHALYGVASVFMHAERYKDALPFLEKIINKDDSNFPLLLDYGKTLTEAGNASKAVTVLSRCVNELKRAKVTEELFYDAQTALGCALEALDQKQNAFQMFLTVSQMTEKQHINAMLGYARIGHRMGTVSLRDVFIVLLNAIARQKNSRKVQQYFAEMMDEQGSIDCLKEQLHEAWNDAPAVIYIATFLRNYGSLESCKSLLSHAMTVSSGSINGALLIMHVRENLGQYPEALSCAIKFLEAKLDRQLIRRVNLAPICKLVTLELGSKNEKLNELITSCASEEVKLPMPAGNLSEAELQLLALYFTLMKVCFVTGNLKCLPTCIRMLDPLCKDQELHKTLVRNEHAYYKCISQIFNECPSPPSSLNTGNLTPIYFVGDSHVLPVAWKDLQFSTGQYKIHPVLVTGLKIWHLRKEASFYTKKAFHTALKAIPQNSVVIVSFGEIDCREGISRAIQKCAYDSLDECMGRLADIYVRCLTEVQKKHRFKLLVHPIPPVLKETISFTRQLNEFLKKRVMKAPKLIWLDFLEDLVDEDTGFLKASLEFDGAHLNPSYTSLLSRSVQKAL